MSRVTKRRIEHHHVPAPTAEVAAFLTAAPLPCPVCKSIKHVTRVVDELSINNRVVRKIGKCVCVACKLDWVPSATSL